MLKSIRTIPLLFLLFAIALLTDSCQTRDKNPELKFDHIVLFASNMALKDSLDRYFTPAEKLTTRHPNQGTKGYYYLFYNTYIELLFLEDSIKASENRERFGSDYLLRWSNRQENNPIGFGMIYPAWDTTLIKNQFHVYHSLDSREDEYYLMAKSNTEPGHPLVYISMPERSYKSIDSIKEIDSKPLEIREDLRRYLTHPSKAKRLNQVTYQSSVSDKEGNLKLLKGIPSIQLAKGDSTVLNLVFDQGDIGTCEIMINPTTRLSIKF